jgi:outer membrane protein assembly factor BamB
VWGWDGPDQEDALRAYDARTGKELWQCPAKTSGEAVASVVVEGGTLYLPSSRSVAALSLEKLRAGHDPVAWVADMKSKGPDVSSPVVCDGLLFCVSRHRHAACLDARTGEVLWRERLRGRGTMAPLVAAGGRVYFCGVTGLTTVVACERTFRRLAENELGEPIFASPAAVGGRLFIRTAKHLWCVEEGS